MDVGLKRGHAAEWRVMKNARLWFAERNFKMNDGHTFTEQEEAIGMSFVLYMYLAVRHGHALRYPERVASPESG